MICSPGINRQHFTSRYKPALIYLKNTSGGRKFRPYNACYIDCAANITAAIIMQVLVNAVLLLKEEPILDSGYLVLGQLIFLLFDPG